jgi:RES domain
MPFTELKAGRGRVIALANPGTTWRVGYRPDPWNWTPWQYAHDGRFNGRWDDPDGRYRTLYSGLTLISCLLEVLACFRPDPRLMLELGDIDEDPEDGALWPTATSGEVPLTWLDPRVASSATLVGTYCSVTRSDTLSALRPLFLARAVGLGLPDLDTAALRLARPRSLTQAISAWLYRQHTPRGPVFDGVHFYSRHGDEHDLLAIFERGTDHETSNLVSALTNL